MLMITLEQLLQLHVLAIEKFGGSDGVRDLGRLESALASQSQEVFEEELYKTVFAKAAALVRAIIADHPFVDGNKRTGMLAGLTLVEMNGYVTEIKKGDLEDFAVQVAVEHLSVEQIAEWLECHSELGIRK